MDLILPDLNANSFKTASGKEYIIYPSAGTGRFPMLEICMVEIQRGVSITGFKEEVQGVYDSLNNSKPADAARKSHDIINGVTRIINKQLHPMYKLCTLFICTADENRETWSEAEAQEKVADWAGIDDGFFLNCARRFVRRYSGGLDIDFPNISTQTKTSPGGEG